MENISMELDGISEKLQRKGGKKIMRMQIWF